MSNEDSFIRQGTALGLLSPTVEGSSLWGESPKAYSAPGFSEKPNGGFILVPFKINCLLSSGRLKIHPEI